MKFLIKYQNDKIKDGIEFDKDGNVIFEYFYNEAEEDFSTNSQIGKERWSQTENGFRKFHAGENKKRYHSNSCSQS